MPLERINSISPASLASQIPQGGGITTNSVVDTMKASQAAEDEKELKMWDALIRSPQQAPAITKAFGREMTPEIEGLLRQPRAAALAVEGAKLGKSMFDRPEAITAFTSAYASSGGDYQAAMQSVQGMKLSRGADKIQQIGKTGYAWDAEQGKAVPIPGLPPQAGASAKPPKTYRITPSFGASVDKRAATAIPEYDDYKPDDETMNLIRQSVMDSYRQHGDFERAWEEGYGAATEGKKWDQDWNLFSPNQSKLVPIAPSEAGAPSPGGDEYVMPAGKPMADVPSQLPSSGVEKVFGDALPDLTGRKIPNGTRRSLGGVNYLHYNGEWFPE